MKKDTEEGNGPADNLVCGRNAVLDIWKAGKRKIDQFYLQQGNQLFHEEPDFHLWLLNSKTRIRRVPRMQLTRIAGHDHHRGIVALVTDFGYLDLGDYLDRVGESKRQSDILVLLDGIKDPRNLGSIIRSCVAAGVGGILLPKDRSVGVTETVMRTSAGAVEFASIIRYTNCPDTLKTLKKSGYWLFGLDLQGKTSYKAPDYSRRKLVFLFGEEEKGLRRSVVEHCDDVIAIPHDRRVNSLNLSVAVALVVFHAKSDHPG